MAARVVVIIVALGLLVFGVAARRDSSSCQDKGAVFFRVVYHRQAQISGDQARSFAAACRGSHFPALAASFLAAHRQAALAISMAHIATRREPDNYEGWLALSRAYVAAGLRGSAAVALRRAVALNPRLGR